MQGKFKQVPGLRYEFGQWQVAQTQGVSQLGGELRVLTYNIWFENVTEYRLSHVLKLIQDSGADFICLQEITRASREAILQQAFIQQNYFVSGNDLSKHGYGVLMLTTLQCWFWEKQFEVSQMDRSLLLAEVINNELIVATSHFESLNNANARKKQMTETFQILGLSCVKNQIVVGDYNFDSSWQQEEQVILDHGMHDAVSLFYDCNSFSMRKSPYFGQWRPDKVVCKNGQPL